MSVISRPALAWATASPPAWVLTEGYAGMESQALGLAEAMGLAVEPRHLHARLPWDWLPGRLWPAPLAGVRSLDGPLAPPWPALAISCGNVAAPVAAALRRRGLPAVHVQDPKMDPRRFDVVVTAEHDGLAGPNVVVARHALHRITPARLAAARAIWTPRLVGLRRPLVSVLVGGANGRYRLDAALAARFADQLAGMAERDGVGLAVTTSRRTPADVTRALTERLAPTGAMVWSGGGDNPYLGMLALADAIIVTCDSVSMMSEAAATTAPLMILDLPGRSRRIARFIALLKASGRARGFEGRFEPWPVAPMNDTPRVAAEVRRRLGL